LVSKAKELDQFYTDPTYAKSFYNQIESAIDLSQADILLEPSAGTGSYYNLMDPVRRQGFDLDPQAPGIIHQDFLEWYPDSVPVPRIVTIGNPPFGKSARLAIQFFNHAATFSTHIAFTIPRTFRKASVINRLHQNFHLIHDETVPNNSFLYEEKPYDVWCCSQIWERRPIRREPIQILHLKDFTEYFEIVEPKNADFAIQRVGGRAGQIITQAFQGYSPESHYFIRAHHPLTLEIFSECDFETMKYNTVGNPSISPSELLQEWQTIFLKKDKKKT